MDISFVCEKIKAECDCREIARDMLGLECEPTRYNKERLSILCPVHNDTHFGSCYARKEYVYCFVDNWHADAIELVKTVRNCSFTEAVEALNNWYGLGLELDSEPENEDSLRLLSSELILLNIYDSAKLKLLYDTDRAQFWDFMEAAVKDIAETYSILDNEDFVPEVESILGQNVIQIKKILEKLKQLKKKNHPKTTLIIRG